MSTFKQRIDAGALAEAVGLEVHVDGWGTGPFFTVRGFDETRGTVLLSTRYSRAIKHRVDLRRVYFTRRAMARYLNRVGSLKGGAK